MDKVRILLAGTLNFGTVGRHIISFIENLSQDPRNEIYVDVDYAIDKTADSKRYIEQKVKAGVVHLSTEKPYHFEYDFLIYTDALTIEAGNFLVLRVLRRRAKIKVCYPVFDGTIPPLEWGKLINAYFDLCLSPSDYCAYNMRRAGVSISCFGLPCAVLNDDYTKVCVNHAEHKVFRFGFIGSNDKRKNLASVIRAFGETFSGRTDVDLFIHSSYGRDLSYEKEIEACYARYKNAAQITLQRKHVSQADLLKIISTFDAYVYPQTTTGFYTTPSEALSAGIPVAISDIPVHKEMLKYFPEKDNVFFIKHDIPRPIFHPALDYRCCGVQFDCDVSAISEQLLKIFSKRESLFSDDLVASRKTGARLISANGLHPLYNNLTHPGSVVLSDDVQGEDGDTLYVKEPLYEKYLRYGFSSSGNSSIVPTRLSVGPYALERSDLFRGIEMTACEEQKVYYVKNRYDHILNQIAKNIDDNAKLMKIYTHHRFLGLFASAITIYRPTLSLVALYYMLKAYVAARLVLCRLLNLFKR